LELSFLWWWGLSSLGFWTPPRARRVASGFLPGLFARADAADLGDGKRATGCCPTGYASAPEDILVGSGLGETGGLRARTPVALRAWTRRRYRHHASSSCSRGTLDEILRLWRLLTTKLIAVETPVPLRHVQGGEAGPPCTGSQSTEVRSKPPPRDLTSRDRAPVRPHRSAASHRRCLREIPSSSSSRRSAATHRLGSAPDRPRRRDPRADRR
jgi:hypothetical protein